MINFAKLKKINSIKESNYVDVYVEHVPNALATNVNTEGIVVLMNTVFAISASKIAKIERAKKLNNNRLNCNRIEQI